MLFRSSPAARADSYAVVAETEIPNSLRYRSAIFLTYHENGPEVEFAAYRALLDRLPQESSAGRRERGGSSIWP